MKLKLDINQLAVYKKNARFSKQVSKLEMTSFNPDIIYDLNKTNDMFWQAKRPFNFNKGYINFDSSIIRL